MLRGRTKPLGIHSGHQRHGPFFFWGEFNITAEPHCVLEQCKADFPGRLLGPGWPFIAGKRLLCQESKFSGAGTWYVDDAEPIPGLQQALWVHIP